MKLSSKKLDHMMSLIDKTLWIHGMKVLKIGFPKKYFGPKSEVFFDGYGLPLGGQFKLKRKKNSFVIEFKFVGIPKGLSPELLK